MGEKVGSQRTFEGLKPPQPEPKEGRTCSSSQRTFEGLKLSQAYQRPPIRMAVPNVPLRA